MGARKKVAAFSLNLLLKLCRWGGSVHRRRGPLRADIRTREEKANDKGKQSKVGLLLGTLLEPDELAPGEHEDSHPYHHLADENHRPGIDGQAA